MNPSSENLTVPRLVPEQPLPLYAFVPGQSPHPFSDPAGHSFGNKPSLPGKLDTEQWPACRAYLYAFDLFNQRYYWESHEQWEGLWHASGRSGVVADFLKGLIKLAAAGVKHLERKPNGVKSHACRAAELWREVARSRGAKEAFFLGFHLEKLIGLAEAVCQQGWLAGPLLLLPTFPDSGYRPGQ
jgi:uncharacterized protein